MRKKFIKILVTLILSVMIAILLKEGGAFSSQLSDFKSLCKWSFLLPEDQRVTVNSIVSSVLKNETKIHPKIDYCFVIDTYFSERKALSFSAHHYSYMPPPIYSIYPLTTMKYLRYLELPLAKGANGDLKPLENLIELQDLRLSYYDQKLDISSIKKLKKLKFFGIKKSLNGVAIDFNSLLVELPNLKSLSIEDPDFVDISSISNFQNLEMLYLTTNSSADFTPLVNLKRLEVLRIYKTKGAKCPNFSKAICEAD